MKFIKFLFAAVFTFVAFTVFAQDTTGIDTTTVSNGTSNWLSANWGVVVAAALGIYEVLARLIPTIKNYSIVSLIVKVLNALVPNKKEIPGSTAVTKHVD